MNNLPICIKKLTLSKSYNKEKNIYYVLPDNFKHLVINELNNNVCKFLDKIKSLEIASGYNFENFSSITNNDKIN